jgi:hypothetical protein
MNLVNGLSCVIRDGKCGDTVPALFLDGSEFLTARRDRGLLTAATLAATRCTGTGTINREKFRFRLKLFHRHLERMDGSAKDAAATAGFFERMRNFCAFLSTFAWQEVPKLGGSFATQQFLETVKCEREK